VVQKKIAKFNSKTLRHLLAGTCTSKNIPVHSPEKRVGNSSLSLFLSPGRKFISLTSVWGALWTATQPAPKQSHPNANYSEYTMEERAKMWRYGAKNVQAKAAGHFSQAVQSPLYRKSICACINLFTTARIRNAEHFRRLCGIARAEVMHWAHKNGYNSGCAVVI